jgi:hypothetical protein
MHTRCDVQHFTSSLLFSVLCFFVLFVFVICLESNVTSFSGLSIVDCPFGFISCSLIFLTYPSETQKILLSRLYNTIYLPIYCIAVCTMQYVFSPVTVYDEFFVILYNILKLLSYRTFVQSQSLRLKSSASTTSAKIWLE